MDFIVELIKENLSRINWEGPASFVIIAIALMAFFRKWSILLIILFTIVLAWGAQDLIISNIETNSRIVSLPLVIYCVGGGIGLLLILISFFKSSY